MVSLYLAATIVALIQLARVRDRRQILLAALFALNAAGHFLGSTTVVGLLALALACGCGLALLFSLAPYHHPHAHH